jgi:hypothetical protein
MVCFKFLRPQAQNFTGDKKRITFEIMFVPGINDPEEKFCYVRVPTNLFAAFLEDFRPEQGKVVDDEEFPDSFWGMAKGRSNKFTIFTPRDKPISHISATLRG